MRPVAARLLCCLTLVLILPGWASAQPTGRLTGTVTDAEADTALSHATVYVVGAARETATTADGTYTLPAVPSGTHTVVVRRTGYQRVRRTDVEVASGPTTRLHFELQEADAKSEETVARAEEPLLYPTAPFRVQRLGREELKRLPTRSPETYYALQPSVALQNDQVHVRGGRPSETDYRVDGLSARRLLGSDNVVPLIPEAVQETQVLAGGPAQLGGANGGIVQQTLRTGGDELSASVQCGKFISNRTDQQLL